MTLLLYSTHEHGSPPPPPPPPLRALQPMIPAENTHARTYGTVRPGEIKKQTGPRGVGFGVWFVWVWVLDPTEGGSS